MAVYYLEIIVIVLHVYKPSVRFVLYDYEATSELSISAYIVND